MTILTSKKRAASLTPVKPKMKKVFRKDGSFTIVALPGSSFGDTQVIDGIEYVIVDESDLTEMIMTLAEESNRSGHHPSPEAWNKVSHVCTSKITDMTNMFAVIDVWEDDGEHFAEGFKIHLPSTLDLSHWDTSNVKTMHNMFYKVDLSRLKHPLGNWDTSKVTAMDAMFMYSAFNDPTIAKWNTSRVTNMASMFAHSTFNQFIGKWDTSNVVYMNNMFQSNKVFNKSLNSWNVSNVRYMSNMFENATSFNKPIGNWDVSGVVKVNYMFLNAVNFNQDLSRWKLGHSVKEFEKHTMFIGARSFVPKGWSVPYVKKTAKRKGQRRYRTIRNWTTEKYRTVQDLRRQMGPHIDNNDDVRRKKMLQFAPKMDTYKKSAISINTALSQYMRNSSLRTPQRPKIFQDVRYLYRAIHGDMARQLKRQKRLQDRGFLGFSRSFDIAASFAAGGEYSGEKGGVLMILDTWKLPEGIPWIWYHGELNTNSPPPSRRERNHGTLLGSYNAEKEVLFPPGEVVLGKFVKTLRDEHGKEVQVYNVQYVPSSDARSILLKKIIRRLGPPKLDSTEPETNHNRRMMQMYHEIMNRK